MWVLSALLFSLSFGWNRNFAAFDGFLLQSPPAPVAASRRASGEPSDRYDRLGFMHSFTLQRAIASIDAALQGKILCEWSLCRLRLVVRKFSGCIFESATRNVLSISPDEGLTQLTHFTPLPLLCDIYKKTQRLSHLMPHRLRHVSVKCLMSTLSIHQPVWVAT